MGTKKIPSIRFDKFSGEWSERRLGDVLQYEQPGNYLVQSTEYNDMYDIPVLTAGQTFILGFTDEEEGIKVASKENPVIIFDDFMTSSHYVEFPFKVKSSAMKFLTLKDNRQDDLYFAYLVLNNMGYNVQSHERHWISKFSDFKVLMPQKEEQKMISNYFHSLEELISFQKDKYEKLQKIKLALLDTMFVHDVSERFPRIRLGDEDYEWESITLGDAVSPYTEYIVTPTDGYVRLGIRSHMNGTFYEYVAPKKRLGEKRLQRVKKDNLIVNIVFAWEHAIAITTDKDEGKMVSHRFPQFSFNNNMYPRFFHYALSDEKFRQHLWLASPSGAGRNKTLRIDEMLQYKMRVPKYKEQIEIANYLDAIDNLIQLYEERLQKLISLKKGCINGMLIGGYKQ